MPFEKNSKINKSILTLIELFGSLVVARSRTTCNEYGRTIPLRGNSEVSSSEGPSPSALNLNQFKLIQFNKFMFRDILYVVIVLAGLYLLSLNNAWLNYKRHWLRREVWLLFGRCPRCNTSVNVTRSGRAICPQCGRPC